jgi:hypothetical protein
MSVIRRVGCTVGLVALGWLAAQAQSAAEKPQFVLELEAPHGSTSVVCVRGCELIGSRDHGNPAVGRMLRYDYQCGNPSPTSRCKATVYGWLRP